MRSLRHRRVAGAILLLVTRLQLRQSSGQLPGNGDSARMLIWCPGRDWWAFLYNVLDDECPVHGWQVARTPDPGTDVPGPCLVCRREMVLQGYMPGFHEEKHLVCADCRRRSGA